MKYDEFVGQVQHRARLASNGEAVRAIHATLETLGERLSGGAAGNLAAQLPQEIGHYLEEVKYQEETGERFSLDEFFQRVALREGTDLPDAVHHARAVIALLQEAVTPGEIEKVRAQLPDEFNPLFESGSEGKMAA